MEKVYLTWNKSQRSKNIARELSLAYLAIEPKCTPALRFSICSLWAILRLFSHRPVTIFIQYSFLLLPIINIYRIILRPSSVVVVDCHTKALRRTHSGFMSRVFNLIKKVSFTDRNIYLIHNPEQKSDIELYSKNYLVFYDPLPSINSKNFVGNEIFSEKSIITFVCSYAVDEPLEQMFEAAKLLSSDYDVIFTGDVPKKTKLKYEASGVKFVGYLSKSEYESLLAGSECVVSLTNEDACLQCAVYEAISINVPCVTSKKSALYSAYGPAVHYVDNSFESIRCGIVSAIENRDILKLSMAEFREQFSKIRDAQKAELNNKIKFARGQNEYN